MMHQYASPLALLTAVAVGLAASAACSSDEGTSNQIGGEDDDDNVANMGTGGMGLIDAGTNIFGDPLGSGGSDMTIVNECAGEEFKAEALPVDMYIMLDRSVSMAEPLGGNAAGPNKWQAVVEAIDGFVHSDSATGIGVGIQYFALPDDVVCDANSYATPAVPIGLLPDSAGAISASITAEVPGGFTPTGPALQGAVNHMMAWAVDNPKRAAVVVLATDGFPTECDPTQLTDIEAIARQGAESSPRVLTFVVGIEEGQANANRIAAAGGTGQAFFIDEGDVREQFLTAMLSIASTTLSCEFDMPEDPEGLVVDPNQVLVRYTPSATGVAEDIVKVDGLTQCTLNQGEGWYFEPPSEPDKIKICPGTCSRFAAGSVRTVIGCKPPTFNPM